MSRVTFIEIGEMVGYQSCVLSSVHGCIKDFPHHVATIRTSHKKIYDLEQIQAWIDTHDVQKEIRAAMSLHGRQRESKRTERRQIAINLDVYNKRNQYVNREEFAAMVGCSLDKLADTFKAHKKEVPKAIIIDNGEKLYLKSEALFFANMYIEPDSRYLINQAIQKFIRRPLLTQTIGSHKCQVR